MSDPTTPVEVLTEEERNGVLTPRLVLVAAFNSMLQQRPRLDYSDDRLRFADQLLAALQAQDHTITKGGLDVERLARALEPAFGPSFFPGLTDVTVFGKTPLEVAEAIAIEYDRAALEPTHD